MLATIDILYNRFLIVLVDEETASASGCGIDKSVRFIQQIEKDYLINLFDRLLVTFRDEHGVIRGTKLQEFEQLVEKGALNADTIVFNNLLGTKEEMSTKWEVAVKIPGMHECCWYNFYNGCCKKWKSLNCNLKIVDKL